MKIFFKKLIELLALFLRILHYYGIQRSCQPIKKIKAKLILDTSVI